MTYYGKEMFTDHPEGCVAMTWEDAERMEKRNEECGWGFGMAKCMSFLADHMSAHEFIKFEGESDWEKANNAQAKMEMIEWRLEDANFHTFRKLLHECDYKGAYAWIGETYLKYLDVEVK